MKKILLALLSIMLLGYFFFPKSDDKSMEKEVSKIEEPVKEEIVKEVRKVVNKDERRKKRNDLKLSDEEKLQAKNNVKKGKELSQKTAAERKSKKIEDFVMVARLNEVAANMDRQMDAALSQALTMDLSQEKRNALLKLKEITTGDKYLEDLKSGLAAALSDEDLNELNKIHEDPIVISTMDKALYHQTPEGQKELMASIQSFKEPETPEEKEKHEAIIRNDKVLGETEASSKTLEKIMIPMMNMASPDGKKMDAKQEEQFKKTFSDNFKSAMIKARSGMYKDLTTAQINEYTDKMDSDAVRKKKKVEFEVAGKMVDKIAEVFTQLSEK